MPDLQKGTGFTAGTEKTENIETLADRVAFTKNDKGELVYPSLSVEHSCCVGHAQGHREGTHCKDCLTECKGRGRVARSPEDPATLFFLLEAIRSACPVAEIIFNPECITVIQSHPKVFAYTKAEPGEEIPALSALLDKIRKEKP